MPDDDTRRRLLARLEPFDQQHVLRFWDELSGVQRRALADQIERVDLAELAEQWQRRHEESDVRALADRAESPPAYRMGEGGCDLTPREAIARGTESLRAGELAMLVVAGGQGTRLGFNHPKGMYPIGPISGATLLQVHIEKVLATARRFGAGVPLCVMTSPATHHETVAFLAEHHRFGLPEEDLLIFQQGTMPAVDDQRGKLLLAERHRLATSPDGHGGALAAIDGSGTLRRLRERGIRRLFYFQVDNPLVQIGSAELIGYHILSGSELTSQVIAKNDPMERVGNVVAVDGRLRVIEYSDLPDDIARRRGPDGRLTFWAGSIAVHVIELDFLGRMAAQPDALPLHVAHKKVAHLDAEGRRVEPTAPNAYKFERFIFDLLPKASGAIVVEVERRRGFAPLKNAPGELSDTPEHVRRQIVAEHRRWLRAAGAEVADGVGVEILPRFALDEVELRERIPPGTRVAQPRLFC